MANGRATVAESAARQLANATKTRAQWAGITPRWLIPFLPWTPVEAGIFRLNRVKETRGATAVSADDVESSPARDTDPDLPETFVDYEEHPREYFLSAITTVLDVQTRVSDLYSRPFDQIQEQLRILIEKVKETHESELINNPEYGLIANVAPSMILPTRTGAPTPDDLDELIAREWKEPSRHRPSICSARLSSLGAACRSFLQTRSRWSTASARSFCSAPARRSRAWSGCSSRGFRARSVQAFRSASWASTARRSRRISCRSTARSRC